MQLAAACKTPDSKGLEGVLLPLSKDIEAVIRAKEANRKDRDWNNHHTVLAEGAPAVGWVAVVSAARLQSRGIRNPDRFVYATVAKARSLCARYQRIDRVLRK